MWERRLAVPKPWQRSVKTNGIPEDHVDIPPLLPNQYVALRNANVAAQVVTIGVTTGVTAAIGFAVGLKAGGPTGTLVGTIVGAMAGVMWGTYEVSCLSSVQEEFDKAYQAGRGVQVWREGWKYNVHGGGDTYTHVNAPISAAYVAVVTFLLTGKLP